MFKEKTSFRACYQIRCQRKPLRKAINKCVQIKMNASRIRVFFKRIHCNHGRRKDLFHGWLTVDFPGGDQKGAFPVRVPTVMKFHFTNSETTKKTFKTPNFKIHRSKTLMPPSDAHDFNELFPSEKLTSVFVCERVKVLRIKTWKRSISSSGSTIWRTKRLPIGRWAKGGAKKGKNTSVSFRKVQAYTK